MYLIPGFVISAITFPGVIAHELSHQIACRLCKVPVYDVQYYKFSVKDKAAGYVVHEKEENPWKNLLITLGPFIFNTLMGIILIIPFAMWEVMIGEIFSSDSSKTMLGLLSIVLGYIGGSCLMNAFPSFQDADNLFTNVLKNKDITLLPKIVVSPFILLIWICSATKVLWSDLAYTAGVFYLLCHIADVLIYA